MTWNKISEQKPEDGDRCQIFTGIRICEGIYSKQDKLFKLEDGSTINESDVRIWFKILPPKHIEKKCLKCGARRI